MINRVILSGNHAGMFYNDNDNEAQITPVVVQVMWSVLFSFLEPLTTLRSDGLVSWMVRAVVTLLPQKTLGVMKVVFWREQMKANQAPA